MGCGRGHSSQKVSRKAGDIHATREGEARREGGGACGAISQVIKVNNS